MHRFLIVALAASLAAWTAPSAGATHVVMIDRMAFQPTLKEVHVGDVIEWRNDDSVPHTATSKDAGFDVDLAPGQVVQSRATLAGRFDVICRYHLGMRMSLIVK